MKRLLKYALMFTFILVCMPLILVMMVWVHLDEASYFRFIERIDGWWTKHER